MYKIQHIATGLFFQPYKARKSSLSVKGGKIYQTEQNCLIYAGFHIYCERGSTIYNLTKDKIQWESCESVYPRKLKAWTKFSDWKIIKCKY